MRIAVTCTNIPSYPTGISLRESRRDIPSQAMPSHTHPLLNSRKPVGDIASFIDLSLLNAREGKKAMTR